jgi:ATP synthase protein I
MSALQMPNVNKESPEASGQWGQVSEQENNPVPWTVEQVAAWRIKKAPNSPWMMVLWQGTMSCIMVAMTWIITSSVLVATSVGYGCLCVVIPCAMFVHGVRVKKSDDAKHRMVRFVVWEFAKIALTIAMLGAAPKVVEGLSWLAMLGGFVVTMKMHWLALVCKPLRNKIL